MDEIKEIKAGQTGYGLLIEKDGYMYLEGSRGKSLTEGSRLSEGLGEGFHCPYPFIVSAVFQKYGIKNANGRIYPESVLKPEVEAYQEKIKQRSAYGECYTPDVKVLSAGGWKNISDIKKGDDILTLNTDTGIIETRPVERKIERHHSGKIIHIHGRHIDERVTPEHEYPVFSRDGRFKGFFTASDLMNGKVPDQAHSYLLKTGKWEGEKCSRFRISDKLYLDTIPFMKFMGIYLSEGCTPKSSKSKIQITQKKESICELIEDMLTELGLPFTVRERKNGTKDFFVVSKDLYRYLEVLGDCYTKYIPEEIKKLDSDSLRTLYDWYVMGDGRVRGDKRRKSGNLTDDVFSVSERLVLDLNEIQLKIGYSGNFHTEERDCDRVIEGRTIKGENASPLHFSLRSYANGIFMDSRFIKFEEEDYDGEVMCVEVENHTWYVMSNGKCHWTKNCNHPDSATIDLGRIAMNIIELHWEDHTLVGKMEITVSEGFRKFGICSTYGDQIANLLLNGLKIGVSSRGLGNVKEEYGTTIVTEYQLVCWDVVSDPSTPNAWIGRTEEELQPYIEEKEAKGKKLVEKLDVLSDWLDE